MDRQEERNVENTMSGNDMQNRCGLKDTQELRSPPEVDCQQPESPQAGPGTWERPARHEPGRVPGGAVTARRWPAPRHPAGPLHAFGPVSALACGQRSCPCSPLCSGFPLPVPLQLRRSWRCRGLGRSSPRGCQRPRRNSACSVRHLDRAQLAFIEDWGVQHLRPEPSSRRAYLDSALLHEVPGRGQHPHGACA